MTDISRLQAVIRAQHYTHSVPSGKSHYFQHAEAIVVLSIPANYNISRFLGCECVWELSRLWAPDGHARNLLTSAIRRAIQAFKPLEPQVDALVSYADPNAGHEGGVYRAGSWTYLGRCEESRVYRRSDGQLVPRRAFHSGSRGMTKAEIEAQGYVQLRLPGKHRYARGLTRKARAAIAARAQ